MDDLFEDREKALDDQFAEYVDRVLAANNDADLPSGSSHVELRALEENVLRLKAAALLARPGAARTARIRANLFKTWEERQKPGNLVSKWLAKTFQNPPVRLAWGAGFALVVLLGVVTQLLPGSGLLVGTAGGYAVWVPVLIVVGIVLILLFFWFDRRN